MSVIQENGFDLDTVCGGVYLGARLAVKYVGPVSNTGLAEYDKVKVKVSGLCIKVIPLHPCFVIFAI